MKMSKVAQREREVFLGAKIRRLWRPLYSEQEQRRRIQTAGKRGGNRLGTEERQVYSRQRRSYVRGELLADVGSGGLW